MLDLFRASYLWLDLAIGFGSAVLVLVGRWTGRLPPRVWTLYWLGAAVGLSWELPIFALSAWSPWPIVAWPGGLPVSPMVLMVSHTLWDGCLFLAGVALVRWSCGSDSFTRFRWRELGVFLLWGQVSELAVELSATFSDAWVWVPGYAWNPVLFPFQGHAITLVPQLIWVAAPVVYTLLVLRQPIDDAEHRDEAG